MTALLEEPGVFSPDPGNPELEQPRLFSMPEDYQEKAERAGIYDASRLAAQRPDAYRAIVAMLQQGARLRAIKTIVGVHHYTIGAVAALERIAIDTGKERVCADLRMVQALLAESMIEDVIEGRIKPEAKALALAIITDKIELMTGGATVRIETSTAASTRPRTWEEFSRKWREQMGLEGGENGQRAIEVEVEVREHRIEAHGEHESPDLQGNDPCSPLCSSSGDHAETVPRNVLDGGGGGR